ncbi:MAG TPA: FAD-binding oxidoreductase [Thermomicrobiaceae bacterium]|nr:FAD-binding oxidoreductase [Thermomicrobiaceae bacterium]
MQTADTVIIGAGVNGASLAMHLARAGAGKIVVVERRHLGAGASGKSGALVRMHYTNEPETRLARVSLDYFQHWGELVGGDCGFQPVGLLVFAAREQRDDLEANVAMQRELGVNTHLISAADARELDPALFVDDVDVVAYEPDSGYADPNATTYGFARAAMALGVEFQLDTPALRVLTEAGRVTGVETTRGTIQAGNVVITAGAWANGLLAPLGIDLGLAPRPARVAVFRAAFERPTRQLTYIDKINDLWARPTDGDCTLSGTEGAQVGPVDPEHVIESLSQEQIELTRQQLANRFPSIRHSTMRGNWAGVLMMSPDSRPVIGRLEEYEGLYCMAGDSGTSFKTAPAIGKCLSELITTGRATTVDLTPFRASRFAEGQPWIDEHDYGRERPTISR